MVAIDLAAGMTVLFAERLEEERISGSSSILRGTR
jgi:hypothetical protein